MMVADVPPKPKQAGPGAAPTLSGPTVIAPSVTVMTELPPMPADSTFDIGKEVGMPAMVPRRSVRISRPATVPMSVVVPPTSIMRTCLSP